jgi:TrmH family RNA methyltransferase
MIEGEKLVNEALNSNSQLVDEVFILESSLSEWEAKLSKLNIEPHIINSKELSQLSKLTTPPPILALCRHFNNSFDSGAILNKVSLYLHELRDPGNMGTIIRTADWFGIETILCSQGCVDIYNPKLIQSSMGSIFRVKLFYDDVFNLKEFKGKTTMYAAALNGTDIFKENSIDNCIILLGSESHGLPEELLNLADKIITVPKRDYSKAESLNVAVAAGIICSQLVIT